MKKEHQQEHQPRDRQRAKMSSVVVDRHRTIEHVVKLVEKSKRIVCLIGAGVSTSSGIPDFRSAGGLYDTLKPDLITATQEQRVMMGAQPTLVVDWQLFKVNPLPYLEVRRPFILGIGESVWKPSLAHVFLAELAQRQKLLRLFSQNIDGLEYSAFENVHKDKIVSCHGSLGTSSCEFCATATEQEWFIDQVKTRIKDIYGVDKSAPANSSKDGVVCPKCSKPGVKPSTVLYGRQLPEDFFSAMESDLPCADLVIVLGTSLTVGPANQVPIGVPRSTPRIILNMEKVGEDLGIQYDSGETGISGRDIFVKGGCDESVAQIIHGLGWSEAMLGQANKMCDKSANILSNCV